MSKAVPISQTVAEAMRAATPAGNPRIRALRERVAVDRYPLCIEKIRLLTESFRRTDGEPRILRRARSLAHVLENISIFIEDGELIVGNAASQPMGVELDCDYGIWSPDEIAALKEEGFTLSDE